MIADDFRHRRAKKTKGRRKKLLVSNLRMAQTMIDHAIIGHVAGDPEGQRKRAEAEKERDALIKELLEITHPAEDILHSRGRKHLKS